MDIVNFVGIKLHDKSLIIKLNYISVDFVK